jgi:hypothetical protein
MANWNKVNNVLSEAVLDADRLEELLAGLGVDVRWARNGRSLRGRCPVHKGRDANFEVRTGGRTLPVYWACFSNHCEKNDQLKNNLLGLVRGAISENPDRPVTLHAAQRYLEEFLARDPGRAPARPARAARPARKTLSLTRHQVRAVLRIPSAYFVGRGFDPGVLDRLDVGASDRLKRAVVPIYDDEGSTCVGYISRSVHPFCAECEWCHPADDPCVWGEPRWMFPADFPKSEYLFSYADARRSDSSFVLLVEGVPDVLRAAEAGIPAVAAFGTDISAAQTKKLVALDKKVVVAFDNDDAGSKAGTATAELLRREGLSVEVRHPPAVFKDVGEMAARDVADWLEDLAA